MNLKTIVQETFESVHEIKDLANDILRTVSAINYERYNEKKEFDRIEGVHLRNVKHKNFPKELADFVRTNNLYIAFLDDDTGDSKANYSQRVHPEVYKRITLHYSKEDIKSKMDAVISRKELDALDPYFIFYFEFTSSLMHELQHAWDDFRSKGNAFSDKKTQAYLRKYHDDRGRAIPFSQTNAKGDFERYRKYLNLPSEVWARFTQAFQKLKFYDADWTDKEVIVTMVPFKDVITDLRYYMPHFHELKDETKKKMYKVIIAYWHKFKEERFPELKREKERQFQGMKP